MEESEGLAYDDPRSGSDATIMGADSPPRPQFYVHDESADSLPNTSRGLAPRLPGLHMEQMPLLVPTVTSRDIVEVHVPKVELDNL